MKYFDREGEESRNSRVVVTVSDVDSLREALDNLKGKEVIELGAGTYNLLDKLHIHKPVHLVGARDEASGSPATILTGRLKVSVSPAEPWRKDQEEVAVLSHLHLASESGCCCHVMQGEVQMHNCRLVCERGTVLTVSEAAVGLHGCYLGSENHVANYVSVRHDGAGLQIADRGEVWATETVIEKCKTGVLLKDRSVVKLHRCKIKNLQQGFG
eukprot:748060-Hanusia_phi.AAC.8